MADTDIIIFLIFLTIALEVDDFFVLFFLVALEVVSVVIAVVAIVVAEAVTFCVNVAKICLFTTCVCSFSSSCHCCFIFLLSYRTVVKAYKLKKV